MSVLDILVTYHEAFLRGLRITFDLASLTWAVGLSLGLILGAAAHRWPVSVGAVLTTLAFLFSGIPFLVLLYWAHFPLQAYLDVVIDPFITASVVLSGLNTAAVAAVWRGALDDFRQEYVVAAQVCGLTPFEIARHIQIPLLLRQVVPTVLALQIMVLQSTLFASLISVPEIFRVAQQINSEIHKPIEIYTALALFFLVICGPAYAVAFWLRRRFTRDNSER